MPKRNICKNKQNKFASTFEPSVKRRKIALPESYPDFQATLHEHQLLQKIAALEAENRQLSQEADENAAKMTTILQQNRKYLKDNADLKTQLAEYENNTEMLVDMLITQSRATADSKDKKSKTSPKKSSRSKSPRRSNRLRKRSPVVITDLRESKKLDGCERKTK